MEDNTLTIIVSVAVLALVGFLFYRTTVGGGIALTDFTRDEQGRIIQILEKK